MPSLAAYYKMVLLYSLLHFKGLFPSGVLTSRPEHVPAVHPWALLFTSIGFLSTFVQRCLELTADTLCTAGENQMGIPL